MTPPETLAGRYAVRRRIGSGGMGEVWLAEDRMLGREVAVKLLDLGSGDDPVATQRFRTEARTAAALSHPNVVAVFDAGTEGSTAFLVMELLPGPTLAQLVRTEGPLPPERAASYARQAAAGLDAVHRVGVVHRDIKPGNLMLDDGGRVKVVDFGIARLAESTAPMLTATGDVVGSAAYLSPERARGEAATAASDHYALGCTLMTLLTGEPPFTAEHPLAVLRQHLDDAPPRAHDRRPDVPAWLDDVVDDLLAKGPVRRAAGFATLLPDGAGAGAAADDASTTAVLDTTAVLPAPVPSAIAPLPAPEPRPGRRTALLATAAVVAVLGLVLLAVALGRDDGDSPAADRTAPSATSTSTDGAETPAPQRTDPAPPAETADTPADTDAAIAALGAAIRDADRVEKKAADDLRKKLEDLQKWQAEDKPVDELTKILDELEKKLEQHESKGDIAPSAAANIRAAVDDVRAAT